MCRSYGRPLISDDADECARRRHFDKLGRGVLGRWRVDFRLLADTPEWFHGRRGIASMGPVARSLRTFAGVD